MSGKNRANRQNRDNVESMPSKTREWPAPQSGIQLLISAQQRHQQEINQILGLIAKDASLPEDANVQWNGKGFIEVADEE